jgi:hypothetical protein
VEEAQLPTRLSETGSPENPPAAPGAPRGGASGGGAWAGPLLRACVRPRLPRRVWPGVARPSNLAEQEGTGGFFRGRKRWRNYAPEAPPPRGSLRRRGFPGSWEEACLTPERGAGSSPSSAPTRRPPGHPPSADSGACVCWATLAAPRVGQPQQMLPRFRVRCVWICQREEVLGIQIDAQELPTSLPKLTFFLKLSCWASEIVVGASLACPRALVHPPAPQKQARCVIF